MNLGCVLAVDPGATTGWCLWRNDVTGLTSTGESDFHDFCGRVDAWSAKVAESGSPGAIVCERYTIGKGTLQKTRQNWSLEVIGVCRYFALKHGLTFDLQSPADAKNFATNDKLKRIGWYTRGKGHANDSVRHLLMFLAKNGILPAGLTSSS